MKTESNRFKLLSAAVAGFVVGVLTVGTVSSVLAAPDQDRPVEIEIGGEKVRLGSSKAALITQLSKELVLENRGTQVVPGVEYWYVKTKSDQDLGSLQFKNDVLVTATREWAEIEMDFQTLVFLKSFYAATERVFEAGTSAHVKCKLNRAPGKELFLIELHSPSQSVSFAFTDQTGSSGKPYRKGFVEQNVYK